MISFNEWKNKPKNLKKDKFGGIIPQDIQKAKKVDLITLPSNVEGTNCGNCRFVIKESGFCSHPEVQQYVNNRNCCALWDNQLAIRHWESEK